MKTGDLVTIRCNGRAIEGVILLASANEQSIMLGFDAMLDGHVGGMPILKDPKGDYRSLIGNSLVTITPREAKHDA